MWLENKKGNLRYVARYYDYRTGKNKKISQTVTKDTKAGHRLAQEMLIERKISIEKAPLEQKAEITIKEVLDKYEQLKLPQLKLTTQKRNKSVLNRVRIALGEDTRISSLTSIYIIEKFADQTDNSVTINEWLKRFKSFINWAYQMELVDDINFINRLKPLKNNQNQKESKDKYLEIHEVKKVLASMDVAHWRLLTKFLVYSGLRIGEALALTRNDIDLVKMIIKVDKTYTESTKKVSGTKTSSSNREVYIQEEMLELINEIDHIMEPRRNSRKALLFCNRNGNYLGYAAYKKYLNAICQKTLEREHKVTPHMLRHTSASLLASEVSLETISRRLGHKNSTITREVYLHTTQEIIRKDNEQVEKIKLRL